MRISGKTLLLSCLRDDLTLLKGLTEWLKDRRKLMILGIGSLIRTDDAAGLEVVKRLEGRVPSNVKLIECETVPESFMGTIRQHQPTHVMMIDAALLNLKPGSSKLIEPKEIAGVPISTHALPLHIFCEYLSKTTGAKVALLAIQPKETGFGEA